MQNFKYSLDYVPVATISSKTRTRNFFIKRTVLNLEKLMMSLETKVPIMVKKMKIAFI